MKSLPTQETCHTAVKCHRRLSSMVPGVKKGWHLTVGVWRTMQPWGSRGSGPGQHAQADSLTSQVARQRPTIFKDLIYLHEFSVSVNLLTWCATVDFVWRWVTSHNKAETVGPYWSTGWEVSVGRAQRLWTGRLSHSNAGVWSNKASNCGTVFATSVAEWRWRRWYSSCYRLLRCTYHDASRPVLTCGPM